MLLKTIIKQQLEANLVIKSSSLGGLLQKAKKILLEKGVKTKSQRGLTWSLNKILLVWTNPQAGKERYSFWSKKEDQWYQNIFVKKRKSHCPENLAKKNDWLFPYTYAQRSRFCDGGLGYSLALVKAAKKIDTNLNQILGNPGDFTSWLAKIGEMVHLQNILSVLKWWQKDLFIYWFNNEKLLQAILNKTRIDALERIIQEINACSLTRRAITPSFIYPLDYFLKPAMGLPPYQNFQLLPGKEKEPLSSLHWHRSLDAAGGAQLDFNHDFDWLAKAGLKTNRPMGTIAILVGNLHLYADSEKKARHTIIPNDNIKKWLAKVTDGYQSGSGGVANLLAQKTYQKNISTIFSKFRKK